MSTGDTIGQDIAAVDAIIGPFIDTLNPAIGPAISGSLKLLAKAEPAVWNSVAAFLQGTPLTPEQTAEKDAAIARLQNPQQYFE